MSKAFYENYQDIKRVAEKYYQDNNMCAVIAVAIACGVGYGKAYHTMRRLGRPKGRGTYRDTTKNALLALGKGFTRSTIHKGRQVKTMPRRLGPGLHLIFVRRHVLVIRDNEVVDWSAGRAHRVQEVWTINEE